MALVLELAGGRALALRLAIPPPPPSTAPCCVRKALISAYARQRQTYAEVMADSIKAGDDPVTVAQVIVTAATDAKPKLRYPAGVTAGRVSLLRRFVPARTFDKQIRKMNRFASPLTLVGRSKDMIIRGRESINLTEIEDVLGHPTVVEVAVIGVPDDKWGELVVAYVQPRPGATVDQASLRALCTQRLSGYTRPTTYVVVEGIAKNVSGEIDKLSLRATHAVLMGRERVALRRASEARGGVLDR